MIDDLLILLEPSVFRRRRGRGRRGRARAHGVPTAPTVSAASSRPGRGECVDDDGGGVIAGAQAVHDRGAHALRHGMTEVGW